MSEIKVGDLVRVTDGGFSWNTYNELEWFEVVKVYEIGSVDIIITGHPGFEDVDWHFFSHEILEHKQQEVA